MPSKKRQTVFVEKKEPNRTAIANSVESKGDRQGRFASNQRGSTLPYKEWGENEADRTPQERRP
jgi:hypothetical protein